MSDLHLAAKLRREYLINKPDVNEEDEIVAALLCYAKSVAEAKPLLQKGALVDAMCEERETPLRKSVDADNYELTSLLLRFGANASSRDMENKTPLHVVRSERIAMLLLKNMAIVNARDSQGSTPLLEASERGDHLIVEALIKFGAEVNAVDDQGRTALHRVSGGNRAYTIRVLMEAGVNVNARDKEGRTALESSIRSGDLALVLLMLVNNPEYSRMGEIEIDPRKKLSREATISRLDQIGGLVDASIKLRVAGLPVTEENIIAFCENPNQRIFSSIRFRVCMPTIVYEREKVEKLKLASKQEVEGWQRDMVVDSMTLDYIMRTESVYYLSDKRVLGKVQAFDYRKYPIYENFMQNKIAKDNLIVFAASHFMKLTEAGKLKNLPSEVVVKILVRLNRLDLQRLISCGINVEEQMSTAERK